MMMRRQSGLGRGLGALIQSPSDVDRAGSAPIISEEADAPIQPSHQAPEDRMFQRFDEIPVERIFPNPKQPRIHFDHAGMDELVASIKEHGILQPLIVTRNDNGSYELIAGERRLRAAKIAELNTVPAIIRNADDQQKLELAIIENVQRKNLNPIEEARAYVQLRDEFGLTQEEVGERVGKSRPQVANIIRLLELEPLMQEALSMGKISQSNARTLLAIPDPQERHRLFQQMFSGNFTVREAEARIPAARRRAKVIDPNVLELEAKLRVYFGSKVAVKRKDGGGGELRVEFQDDEDLRRILEKLQAQTME